MKNLIITIIIFTMSFATANAQIKKTKNKTNTGLSTKTSTDIFKGNKPAIHKGLKVANLNSLSIDNLNKLKIPKYNISLTKLNARAIRTWKISPTKPVTTGLKLKYFSGYYQDDNSVVEWRLINSMGYTRDRFNSGQEIFRNRGFTPVRGTDIFSLRLNFKDNLRGEYRLKIKFGRNVRRGRSILVGFGQQITELPVSFDEVNFVFVTQGRSDSNIYISGTIDKNELSNGRARYFDETPIKEIKIDRIDN